MFEIFDKRGKTNTEPNQFWFVRDWIGTWREIFELIINMTKLLDSDRLAAVDFIFSNIAKIVNSVQITQRILAIDWLLNSRVW